MKFLTILNAVLFFFSGCWPRKNNKLVFGAWLGTKFADNPKYLLLHLAAHAPELDLVWIGQEEVRGSLPGGLPVRFVRRGSLAAFYETLTAGCCFITHSTNDISRLTVLNGAKVIYLGHGLALKHMGTPSDVLSRRWLQLVRALLRKPECYAFFAASSECHGEKLLHEYAINGATPDKILPAGQPRVDFLIRNQAGGLADQIRTKLLASHPFPSARRIITYMPTFRDKRQRAFSFLTLEGNERDRLNELLEKFNAVIMEKSHFADAKRETGTQSPVSGRLIGLSGNAPVDTQEILLATDILITDYSGCYLDYLVLDRPVLHFAYDREYYTNSDRGLYFDLDVVAGGPVVERFDALCEDIEQDLLQPDRHHGRRESVRKSLMAFETGEACRKICHAVLAIGQ